MKSFRRLLTSDLHIRNRTLQSVDHLLHSCCIFIRLIYDKIDKDQSGQISEEELVSWIRHVQKRYILSDTDRQWHDHIPENEDTTMLKWDVYMDRTYGHMDGTFACCNSGHLLQISSICVCVHVCVHMCVTALTHVDVERCNFSALFSGLLHLSAVFYKYK